MGQKGCVGAKGGGVVSRTRQSLICFPLGWEGGDRSNFFSAAPWGGKKNGQIMGLDLKQIPPRANLSKGGVSTSDRRARTWRRLNNPSRTRICKSAGAPPPLLRAALRMHFALGSTAMQTDTHMHARKKKKKKKLQRMSRGQGGVLPSTEKHWPPLRQKDTPVHATPCLERAATLTSQEARVVTAPCGKGEGAQRSPQPRSLYAPPPPPPPNLQSPPASCALTFLGGGCMMLKGHQSSAHPRRRRLKDCEGESGWRKRGRPRKPGRARVCVKGEPEEKEEESARRLRGRRAAGAPGSLRVWRGGGAPGRPGARAARRGV